MIDSLMELFGIAIYFFFLFLVIFWKRKRKITQEEFVIGGRSLNRWTTALAAHASDMSNWLLMGYPGMVYLAGGRYLWAAIGLTTIMWLNWIWIAPKVREQTEKLECRTLVDFLEKRLGGNWAMGRIITASVLVIFYTVYVAAALYGMGILIESLFGLPFWLGVVLGVGVIVAYVVVGGYLTLAQVDLVQGMFLLGVLLFVSLFVGKGIGVEGVMNAFARHGKSLNLFEGGLYQNLLLAFGWGLGYFGQPHIVSKFMGIRDVADIRAAKRIGVSWQFLSMGAASLIAIVGVAYYDGGLADQERVFIDMVRGSFSPFISGVFLCAVIAAMINAVCSMLLVLSTTISEDIFLRFVKKDASDRQLLFVARLSSGVVALVAMGIALARFGSINDLVFYAWSGLGASFGPLLIMALYAKRLNGRAAWMGMAAGGGCVALWPLVRVDIPSLVVGFVVALGVIWSMSKSKEVERVA